MDTKEKHPTILETVYESALGLFKAGLIDAVVMHEFDELCLIENKEQYEN
ncbi:MAG TPA: hypothetical protein VKR58_10970 [Aquella sp.]|nr:hypothetical protein [Aquella sp.]